MFSVIFDMDGTLLDTQKICIPAWDYAGEQQGESGMGRYIPHVCGMNAHGWSAYVLERHPNMDMERFNLDTRNYILDNLKIRFKPGAEELLDYLQQRGIKIAIASGSSHESIEHHLRELGVYERFDSVVGGHDVEHGKPAPDIFLLAAEKLGVRPSDCFVFEDSENGVYAGHAAGMRVFGIADIAPFSEKAKSLMYRELSDMSEAIEIFRELYPD